MGVALHGVFNNCHPSLPPSLPPSLLPSLPPSLLPFFPSSLPPSLPSFLFSSPLLPSVIQSEVSSLREGGIGGGRREEVKRRRVSGGKGGSKKDAMPSPMFFETELLCPNEENPARYKHIAGLSSELLAVDMDGQLWRWAWQSCAPEPHPLIKSLGLEGEKVRFLGGRLLRASVVTESGKVSLYLSLSMGVNSLPPPLPLSLSLTLPLPPSFPPPHPRLPAGWTTACLRCCMWWNTLLIFLPSWPGRQWCSWKALSSSLPSSHLPTNCSGGECGARDGSTSDLILSLLRCHSRGMFPFPERKQALVEVQEKLRGTSRFPSREHDIKSGSQVCLRSSPIYTAGTKAIFIKGPRLQV